MIERDIYARWFPKFPATGFFCERGFVPVALLRGLVLRNADQRPLQPVPRSVPLLSRAHALSTSAGFPGPIAEKT